MARIPMPGCLGRGEEAWVMLAPLDTGSCESIQAGSSGMPHADDIWPRNAWVLGLCLKRHPCRGFADDLDESHQRQIEHTIRIQVGACATSRKANRLAGGVAHMEQAHAVTLRERVPGPWPGPRRESIGSRIEGG